MNNDRLRQLVAPHHTAVVAMEMQKGIVARIAPARAAEGGGRERDVATAGRVARAARASGVRVVHATMRERPTARARRSMRIFAVGAKYKAEHGHSPTRSGNRAWNSSTSSTCSRATSRYRACTA